MLKFWAIFTVVTVVFSQDPGFCEDYLKCMEGLEEKQHECLSLDRNLKSRNGDECSRRKWEKKMELNALHMRRAEIARDCVQKNRQDAELAETTLDADTMKQCASIHEKFQFATSPSNITNNSTSRKKRSNGKRTKRENNSKKGSIKATECRTSARIWHKQCAALAKCCPLAEDCKQSTQEIMEQIFEGRHKLNELHNECI